MNVPPPIADACAWAQQTAIFVLRSPQVYRDPKTAVPMEVHEQTQIRAQAAMEKLAQEAQEECGLAPLFLPVFTAKVLDWVVKNWPPPAASASK